MKITIDTSRDSKEDIQKAISFLKKLVGEEVTDFSENTTDMPSAFGLFDDSDDNSSDNESEENSYSSSNVLEDDEDDPKIEIIRY